jgi:hypothetical protein
MEKALRGFFAAHQTGQMIAAVPSIAPVADSILDAAASMTGNRPTAGPGPVSALALPRGPISGLTQMPIEDHRTGITFNPGAANAAPTLPPDTTPDTPANPDTPAAPPAATMPATPALPAPPTGTAGAETGIETMRNEQQ